jgi:hypothetical protein
MLVYWLGKCPKIGEKAKKGLVMKKFWSAVSLAGVLSAQFISGGAAALAQVNTINSVVFGSRIPKYLDDPTGGMPVRNTAADFLSVVPAIAGARAITFSPCSDSFLTCSGSSAALWNASRGSQNMALQHGGPIRFIAFGKDGSFVVTSGGVWTRIWSAPQGEFKFQFDHKSAVRQLIVSPDGTKLAVLTAAGFELWSLNQGVKLLSTPVEVPIRELIFNPNSQQFLTLDGRSTTLWTVADGQPVGHIEAESPIASAVFSPDGSHVICATENRSYLWDTKQFIKVADIQFGAGDQ